MGMGKGHDILNQFRELPPILWREHIGPPRDHETVRVAPIDALVMLPQGKPKRSSHALLLPNPLGWIIWVAKAHDLMHGLEDCVGS